MKKIFFSQLILFCLSISNHSFAQNSAQKGYQLGSILVMSGTLFELGYQAQKHYLTVHSRNFGRFMDWVSKMDAVEFKKLLKVYENQLIPIKELEKAALDELAKRRATPVQSVPSAQSVTISMITEQLKKITDIDQELKSFTLNGGYSSLAKKVMTEKEKLTAFESALRIMPDDFQMQAQYQAQKVKFSNALIQFCEGTYQRVFPKKTVSHLTPELENSFLIARNNHNKTILSRQRLQGRALALLGLGVIVGSYFQDLSAIEKTRIHPMQ